MPKEQNGSTTWLISWSVGDRETGDGSLSPYSDNLLDYLTKETENRPLSPEEVLKAGIPIRLFQGCEIYTTRNCIENILQNLKSGRLPSMNRTRYILAEFSVSGGDFAHAQYCLNRYLEEGWIPIIAHAERYCRTFASVENIHALKEAGCLVQVNYYDLAEEPDHEIRTCAQNLLQAELVDMMGSDAHRTDHRAPKLARGAKYIKENCRAEYAENVLRRNAERLLMGTQ